MRLRGCGGKEKSGHLLELGNLKCHPSHKRKDYPKCRWMLFFGKLDEQELDLSQLERHEEQEKKKSMEDMSLFVKKFSKFLKRNKASKSGPSKKFIRSNGSSTSGHTFTCFECGKLGHIKANCPTLKKILFKGKVVKKAERRAIFFGEIMTQTPIQSLKLKSEHTYT
ncbi:hypothetical protein Lal_00038199 [Lupinus albus]|nr:hypothetical protein Lal_00038199 [Lupinus albus]